MTAPPPTSSYWDRLDRYRKNYAQNPLWAFLWSGSALTLLPKSYRRFPGAPALWTIPVCAASVAYGGYGTALGDSLNGAGITAAWSGAYYLVNWRRAFPARGRSFTSFLVLQFALFNGFVYGSYYFLDADTARRSQV